MYFHVTPPLTLGCVRSPPAKSHLSFLSIFSFPLSVHASHERSLREPFCCSQEVENGAGLAPAAVCEQGTVRDGDGWADSTSSMVRARASRNGFSCHPPSFSSRGIVPWELLSRSAERCLYKHLMLDDIPSNIKHPHPCLLTGFRLMRWRADVARNTALQGLIQCQAPAAMAAVGMWWMWGG